MNLDKTFQKYKLWLIPLLIILGVIALLKKPEFFDYFGVVIFLYFILSSMYMLRTNKYPKILIYINLIIGSAGLVIDLINVLK